MFRAGRCLPLVLGLILAFFLAQDAVAYRKRVDRTKCPKVRTIRNFDLEKLTGSWYVVQYYATSEEVIAYRCMRAVLSTGTDQEHPGGGLPHLSMHMNFTYSFADDPNNELLVGNISWHIPDAHNSAHWVHAEDSYEGIYNTFVLDSDYTHWSLLLHCAEKSKSPRYLSSLLMSRQSTLPQNVVAFLRDKLPRYDIALEYMFPMGQANCEDASRTLHYASSSSSGPRNKNKKHPMKHRHAKREGRTKTS